MSQIKALTLFFKKSIKVRLLFYFLLTSMLPLILVGYIPYYQTKTTVEGQMLELSQSVVNQVNQNINYYMKDMDLLNDTIYYQITEMNVKRVNLDIEEIRQFIIKQKANRPFIENISVHMENHTISTVENIDWNVLLSKDWFNDALNYSGESTWVGPHLNDYISTSQTKGVISLVYPFEINNKEKIVILIDMKKEEFEKLFARPDLTRLGTLLVIDKFGEIIYSTDESLFRESKNQYSLNKAYVSNNVIIEKLKENNHFIYDINFISGWKIAALIPESKINESFSDIKEIVFWLLGIFIVISFVMALLLSNSIFKPLKKLQRDIMNVEKGNFNLSPNVGSIDEIGKIGLSFNKMVEEIKRLMERISENEKKKKQIEMQSLQYQINPHFLYNTLNSVQWIAKIHRVPDISEMLTSLIKLLRASLSSINTLHTLEQELEILDFYLKIQNQRYPDCFQVKYKIDNQLLSAKVPRFILQPLVENIFFHAFADGKGEICIEASSKDNFMQIAVQDDGRGIKATTMESVLKRENDSKRKTSSGIGIQNVEDKIKLYFGSIYGLHISSEEGKGTTIFINLPITFEQGEDDEDLAKGVNSGR